MKISKPFYRRGRPPLLVQFSPEDAGCESATDIRIVHLPWTDRLNRHGIPLQLKADKNYAPEEGASKILDTFIDMDCGSGERSPFRDTPALTALYYTFVPAIDITMLHWKVHPIALGRPAQGFHRPLLSPAANVRPLTQAVLTLSPIVMVCLYAVSLGDAGWQRVPGF